MDSVAWKLHESRTSGRGLGREGNGGRDRGRNAAAGSGVLAREPRLFPITNGAIREPAGGDYF